MGQVVSIELLLDVATEARVRHEWDALAAAGLPSLANHVSPSNRPHITLVVRSELKPFHAADLVGSLPIPLTLGGPTLFGAGEHRVLVRSVVPTRELLELHAAVHERVGPGDDARHTSPGEWSPHVTLARRLRLGDLPAAVPLVGEELRGQVVGIRRWDAASATVTDLG
ncbi:2'-5' RNA ligase family protein [Microbacterium sp. DT81.1]|uniref:2'-5' RNA ligase family protein n=1 Tax=Microbacterium sp. DT81.1 TaxID=3393413 RepID=UPI003CE97B2B